jgi:hypothetical protein
MAQHRSDQGETLLESRPADGDSTAGLSHRPNRQPTQRAREQSKQTRIRLPLVEIVVRESPPIVLLPLAQACEANVAATLAKAASNG